MTGHVTLFTPAISGEYCGNGDDKESSALQKMVLVALCLRIMEVLLHVYTVCVYGDMQTTIMYIYTHDYRDCSV